jgi:hypothetical protein
MSWDNPTDRDVGVTRFLREMEEHMVRIKNNLKAIEEKK